MKKLFFIAVFISGFAASYGIPQSGNSKDSLLFSYPDLKKIHDRGRHWGYGLDIPAFSKQKSIVLVTYWCDVPDSIKDNIVIDINKNIVIYYLENTSNAVGKPIKRWKWLSFDPRNQKGKYFYNEKTFPNTYEAGFRSFHFFPLSEREGYFFSIDPPIYFQIFPGFCQDYNMIYFPDVESLLSSLNVKNRSACISYLIDNNINPAICENIPLIKTEREKRNKELIAEREELQEENQKRELEKEKLDLYSLKDAAFKHYQNEVLLEMKNSGLFLPKDEFETDIDYQKRVEESKNFSSELIMKYCLLYKDYLAEKEANEENARKIKIRQSYSNVTLSILTIGTYNTTTQTFPVSFDGKAVNLEVPLAEAKSFKENYLKAQVKADKQFAEDGKTYEIFNIRVVHPVSGSVYICGLQHPPLYLDVVSTKVTTNENGIPRLTAEVRFSEPSGNNLLDGGETGKFFVKVMNEGDGTAAGIVISLSAIPNGGLAFDQSKSIGGLLAGQSQTVEFNVIAKKDITNQDVEFKFSFTEQHGFKPAPINYRISTQEFKAPKIVLKEAGIKEISGNKNNIIENNELIEITALVQNTGQGPAEETQAMVKLGDPNIITTTPGLLNQKLGTMAPNETRLVKFNIAVNNEYNGSDKLPITLTLSEKYKLYGGSYPLNIEMKKVQLSAANVTLTGKYTPAIAITDPSLLSSIDKNIPLVPSKNPNRIALIIGNEDYSSRQTGVSSESNVPYANSDARSVKEYMIKTLGLEERNTFLLLNATAGEMIQEIDRVIRLSKQFAPNAEIIFFYAGHGYPDENSKVPYLIPVDISATNLSAGIKLSDLYERLAASGAKRVTVFLDACFSGGGRAAGLMSEARGVKIKPSVGGLEGNLVVFAAASGEQSALPFNQERHGMFTYFLLKKIQETSGNISYSDLFDYLKWNVNTESLRLNKKEQQPEMLISPAIQNDYMKWMLR